MKKYSNLNRLCALLTFTGLAGCTNISSFNDPYVSENFLGTVIITIALKGITPDTPANAPVSIVGNGSGSTVTIAGLPDNKAFKIFGELSPSGDSPAAGKFPFPPAVAGFVGDVVGKKEIHVNGFYGLNEAAKYLELEVQGTLIREGPRIATKPGEPILIQGKVGKIRDFVPELMQGMIVRTSDGKTLAELDDNEVVSLFQINYKGDAVSVL